MFGDFRIKHGLRSKRPKKNRPTTVDVQIEVDEIGKKLSKIITINRKEFPAPAIVYKYGSANYFKGLPYGTNVLEWEPVVIVSDSEMKEFHKKYGNYIHKARMAPFELARMLAKIAHGFAVVDFGVDGFDHLAGNIDTILNKTQDVGYSVGGVKYDLEPILDRDHSIRHVMIQRGPFDIGKIIVPIVYEIRLFCQIKGFPAYYVLVGHLNLNKKEHKITFQNKLDMIKDSKLETIVL